MHISSIKLRILSEMANNILHFLVQKTIMEMQYSVHLVIRELSVLLFVLQYNALMAMAVHDALKK